MKIPPEIYPEIIKVMLLHGITEDELMNAWYKRLSSNNMNPLIALLYAELKILVLEDKEPNSE